MRIGSLFSGAGGLDLAVLEVFGGKLCWHAEIDKAASKVLAHRFPGVPNLGSVTDIDWVTVPPVDVLCGGFPCTDVSAAGKRAGMHGTRSGLWSHMAEAIDVLRPRYVVIENVRGLLNANANRPLESATDDLGNGSDRPVLRAIGAVLGDISDIGTYEARWVTMAAADVGAPHRRERVFILAADAPHPGDRSRDHRGERADGVALLPTPTQSDGTGGGIRTGLSWEGTTKSTGDGGNSRLRDVAGLLGPLLPTPRSSDCFGAGLHGDGGMDLRTTVALFRTPNASDYQGRAGHQPSVGDQVVALSRAWGKYEPAIRRWEQLAGPAPAPTEPNKSGNPRLSAAFSEWLMGWPPGWVTHPDIGISRNDQLRIIGNGVCPQQALAALRYLLTVSEVAA